jgi:prepilin-type processing-associated H-X9-DG protein
MLPAYAISLPETSGPWGGASGNRATQGQGAFNMANSTVTAMAPATFSCPSVPDIPLTIGGVSPGPRGAYKDYGNNAGTGIIGCCPERLRNGGPNPSDGMSAVDLSINMRDVIDGTSNTFLFLELTRNAEHSWVAKNTGSNPFFWVHHPSQGMCTAAELGNDTVSGAPFPPNTNFPNSRGAIGGHPGGLNIAFVDGHVAFIKNSISFKVYQALFSRSRGEVLSADSY